MDYLKYTAYTLGAMMSYHVSLGSERPISALTVLGAFLAYEGLKAKVKKDGWKAFNWLFKVFLIIVIVTPYFVFANAAGQQDSWVLSSGIFLLPIYLLVDLLVHTELGKMNLKNKSKKDKEKKVDTTGDLITLEDVDPLDNLT